MREITETIEGLGHWKYNKVDIDSMIEDLVKIKKLGVTHVEIDTKYEWGDTVLIIKPIKKRMETKEEFDARIKKEKELGLKKKEVEFKRYQELKKQFENE